MGLTSGTYFLSAEKWNQGATGTVPLLRKWDGRCGPGIGAQGQGRSAGCTVGERRSLP